LNVPVQQIHVDARSDIFKRHAVSVEMIVDYEARLSDENTYIFIGEVEGEPIGYILAQLVERPENPYTFPIRFILIDQMSVNPKHQSKGYGEQLMQQVFELARAQGINTVLLTVWAFNSRAMAFYERQGFTVRDMRMEAHLE
jgi:GNAT superfamily N-acetyltransferase